MTSRSRSASASKGLPVNYCSGFRSFTSTSAMDGEDLLPSFLFNEMNGEAVYSLHPASGLMLLAYLRLF